MGAVKGWKSVIVGAFMVIGVPLLTYFASIDWEAHGVSPAVAFAISGVITLALRAVTTSAIGRKK